MASISIVLTEQMLKIPYPGFTDCKVGDVVDLPNKPYTEQILRRENLDYLSTDDLVDAIETSGYLCVDATSLVRKILSKVGKNRKIFGKFFVKDESVEIPDDVEFVTLYQQSRNMVYHEEEKEEEESDDEEEKEEEEKKEEKNEEEDEDEEMSNDDESDEEEEEEEEELVKLKLDDTETSSKKLALKASGKNYILNPDLPTGVLDEMTRVMELKTHFSREELGVTFENVSIFRVVAQGNTELVHGFLGKEGVWSKCPLLPRLAAEGGHLDILDILYNNGYPFEPILFFDVISFNRSKCLKFLLEKKVGMGDNDYISFAAELGNLECVKIFYQYSKKFTFKKIYTIFLGGDLDCIKFAFDNLIDRYIEIGSDYYMSLLDGYIMYIYLRDDTKNKDEYIELIKYIIEKGFPCKQGYASRLAFSGHFGVIDYLLENNYIVPDQDFYDEMLINAAAYGDLDRLEFYLKKGACITPQALVECPELSLKRNPNKDSLACFEFCDKNKGNNCRIDANTIERVLINGDIKIFKYIEEKYPNLLENGIATEKIPCTSEMPGEKHAECLRYLIEKKYFNKCLYIIDPIEHKHFECFDIFCRNGGVGQNLQEAIASGNVEFVRTLLKQKCSRPKKHLVELAIETSTLEMVKFLIDKTPKVRFNAISCAASLGKLDIVHYLYQLGYKVGKNLMATVTSQTACFVYLHENGVNFHKWTFQSTATLESMKYIVSKGYCLSSSLNAKDIKTLLNQMDSKEKEAFIKETLQKEKEEKKKKGS